VPFRSKMNRSRKFSLNLAMMTSCGQLLPKTPSPLCDKQHCLFCPRRAQIDQSFLFPFAGGTSTKRYPFTSCTFSQQVLRVSLHSLIVTIPGPFQTRSRSLSQPPKRATPCFSFARGWGYVFPPCSPAIPRHETSRAQVFFLILRTGELDGDEFQLETAVRHTFWRHGTPPQRGFTALFPGNRTLW